MREVGLSRTDMRLRRACGDAKPNDHRVLACGSGKGGTAREQEGRLAATEAVRGGSREL